MLRDQPAVPTDRTSVSEKSLTDNLHLLLFLHRIHCCPLLFHSKSCKTVPERQSMRAHFSPTANQWNSTNSTVICILHLPCVPPLPYLSMSPPPFSLSLFLRFQLGLTIVLQVMFETQHKHFKKTRTPKTEIRLNQNSAFKVHRVWSISTCLIVQHHIVIANTSAGLLRAFCHWLPPYTHTHMGLIWHLKTLY